MVMRREALLASGDGTHGGVPVKEIQTVPMHGSITATDRYIRRTGSTADILAAPDTFDKEKKKAGKLVPFPALAKGI